MAGHHIVCILYIRLCSIRSANVYLFKTTANSKCCCLQVSSGYSAIQTVKRRDSKLLLFPPFQLLAITAL